MCLGRAAALAFSQDGSEFARQDLCVVGEFDLLFVRSGDDGFDFPQFVGGFVREEGLEDGDASGGSVEVDSLDQFG